MMEFNINKSDASVASCEGDAHCKTKRSLLGSTVHLRVPHLLFHGVSGHIHMIFILSDLFELVGLCHVLFRCITAVQMKLKRRKLTLVVLPPAH